MVILLPPPPPELASALELSMNQVQAIMIQQAATLDAQLHDFLCSGAMPRDLSLVKDRDVHRFDMPWRPPAPLRIR